MSLKDGLKAGVATLKTLRRKNHMKKEDLIALGIDEEVVKQIMALHGKTVTQLNAQLATAESERDSAKEQLTTNQTELDALKESAKGNEELSEKLAELQTKYDEAQTTSEKQLSEQKKDFAIKLALKEAKTLDENIVLGLLDKETIKVTDEGLQGFQEQLKTLQESKSFLFQQPESDESNPKFVNSKNAQGSNQMTEEQKMAEALGIKPTN